MFLPFCIWFKVSRKYLQNKVNNVDAEMVRAGKTYALLRDKRDFIERARSQRYVGFQKVELVTESFTLLLE